MNTDGDQKLTNETPPLGCDFFIEIYAPAGLSGIEPYLPECKLPLEPWVSGFNGQVILRYTGGDGTEFDMDPSTCEVMNASGTATEPYLRHSLPT